LRVPAATSRSLEGAAALTTLTAATLSNPAGARRRLRSTIPQASATATISSQAASARLLTEPTLLTETTLAIASAGLTDSSLLAATTKLGSLPGTASECLSGLSVGRASLVEALLGRVVAVLHTLAVLGIVLPLASVPASSRPARRALFHAIARGLRVVDVLGEVVCAAAVDVHVTTAPMPVAVAPQRRAHRGHGHEVERAGREVTRGIWIIRRVGRRERAVDDRRVITRHVDDFRVRRLDLDHCRRGLGDLHRRLGRRHLHRGLRRWRRCSRRRWRR